MTLRPALLAALLALALAGVRWALLDRIGVPRDRGEPGWGS